MNHPWARPRIRVGIHYVRIRRCLLRAAQWMLDECIDAGRPMVR